VIPNHPIQAACHPRAGHFHAGPQSGMLILGGAAALSAMSALSSMVPRARLRVL
jgi:hypothetical protein